MGKKVGNTNLPDSLPADREESNLQEYPIYPASDDIYSKYRKQNNIDPEDISKIIKSGRYDKAGRSNEKDYDNDMSGSDLDVPGSDLDDDQEMTGNEDEENNYYSLGGDDHNDLDEDQGE